MRHSRFYTKDPVNNYLVLLIDKGKRFCYLSTIRHGRDEMQINMATQIERVVAVQNLSRAEAADQVRCRIYDARQYLKQRATR